MQNLGRRIDPRLIWISVGELSGDMHAADLVDELSAASPGLSFRGICGPSLLAHTSHGSVISADKPKFDPVFGIDKLSLMGGTEVLSALPRILRLLSKIKEDLRKYRPDAVILVDAPDFNFRVAKIAASLNIPVYYYISPKIWAWRSSRANFLKKYTRRVICILPFEKEFYARYGMDVPYVGNPLVAAMNLPELDKYPTVPGRIGLMPGSRKKEVTALMPLFAQAADIISSRQPGLSFHCIQAPGISEGLLQSLWNSQQPLCMEPSADRYAFMKSCECILAASGTATLECALAGTPTVVAYKLSALTGYLARKVLNVKYVSLPNLILNREIFPELLQDDARSEFMADHILNWLQDENAQLSVASGLLEVRNLLGDADAPKEAARIILDDYNSFTQGLN